MHFSGSAGTVLLFALGAAMLCLPACNSCPSTLKKMAKSDIDMVADAHFSEVDRLLRELTIKLYRRNPRELRKNPGASLQSRQLQVFETVHMPAFTELKGRRGTAAIDLCFQPEFKGDRVFALVAGLRGMMLAAYGNRDEQFLFDSLDPQELYNSARNLEIVVWRLSNLKNSNGEPFLYTNSLAGEEKNLSYERLFGKLIALQDMMTTIAAGQHQRVINKVVQSLASSVLLPVGL